MVCRASEKPDSDEGLSSGSTAYQLCDFGSLYRLRELQFPVLYSCCGDTKIRILLGLL